MPKGDQSEGGSSFFSVDHQHSVMVFISSCTTLNKTLMTKSDAVLF